MADTCCGCIELRTGCLIIGYLQLVCGIIILVAMVVGGAVVPPDGENSHAQVLGDAAMIFGLIFLLVIFFTLTFTITLLVGVHQNKRGHVKAYLIYACIFMVLSCINFFASFTEKLDAWNVGKDLISILLDIYFLLVIRRYYRRMDDNRSQIYNTTFKAEQEHVDPLMV